MQQIGPIFGLRIGGGQLLESGAIGLLVALLGGSTGLQLIEGLRSLLAGLLVGVDRLVAGLGGVREVVVQIVGLGQEAAHRQVGAAGREILADPACRGRVVLVLEVGAGDGLGELNLLRRLQGAGGVLRVVGLGGSRRLFGADRGDQAKLLDQTLFIGGLLGDGVDFLQLGKGLAILLFLERGLYGLQGLADLGRDRAGLGLILGVGGAADDSLQDEGGGEGDGAGNAETGQRPTREKSALHKRGPCVFEVGNWER